MTFGSQPTLEQTQAVGAVLLHQFARQRFIEAGLNVDLIQEAEDSNNLGPLAASLIASEQCPSFPASNPEISQSEISHSDETSTLRAEDGEESTTTLSFENRQENSDAGDYRFHSIISSSANGHENTTYHSINDSRDANAPSHECFDRAASLAMMSAYGRELRRIAEEFEKTQLRKDIKNRADKVKLEDINKKTFCALLEELFHDGITRVKIVTLFFFCTDVALKAASEARERAKELIAWSFSYIIDTVCRIVHKLGGWEHVLFRQIPSLLVTCCAVLGILALTVYLRRSLLQSRA